MGRDVRHAGWLARRKLAGLLGLPTVLAACLLAWCQFGSGRATPALAGLPVALGAHALVGQEQDRLDPVARTPALRTAVQGSSLVAFVAGHAANDAAPTDSYHNDWQRLGSRAVYRGYGGRFDARAYLVPQARGGRDHRVMFVKHARPDGEATLVVVEVRNAGQLLAARQVYPQPGLRVASGSIRTDGPALLVALWFGDSAGLRHFVAVGDGFRVVERLTTLPPHSAVQAVLAVREVDRVGSYAVHWYAAPPQGAILWLLAFAPSAQPFAGSHSSRAMPSASR